MKAFIAAIMALISVFGSLLGGGELKAEFDRKGTIEGLAKTAQVQKELTDFNVDADGDFTVLQFSDTHFRSMANFSDLYLLNKMSEQVKKEKPDLVVVTGDMINDGDSGMFNKAYVLRSVAEMFEEENQYWAYVPGNNDGLNYGSSEDVTAYLLQYEHCLVSDERDISGGAQYSVDIYNENVLTHSLVFLDTMDYDNEDDYYKYGYVHEDQVQWCKEEIASKKRENPNVKVSVFMHENTPAFQKAAQHGSAYKSMYPTISKMMDNMDIPKNQPLDDVFDNSGCVGLVAIGHVHPAAAQCSFYNNTYYSIAPQTTLASVIITIHTAENSIKDMYDFEALYL